MRGGKGTDLYFRNMTLIVVVARICEYSELSSTWEGEIALPCC